MHAHAQVKLVPRPPRKEVMYKLAPLLSTTLTPRSLKLSALDLSGPDMQLVAGAMQFNSSIVELSLKENPRIVSALGSP